MIDLSDEPLPRLPERSAESHKGDYGAALIIGGSLGMAGAPALAGMACLRSGAGLVSLAVPRSVQATVAAFSTALMSHALPDNGETISAGASEALSQLRERIDAIAIGPGLGRSTELTELCTTLFRESDCPMVFDADGLNALAQRRDSLSEPSGPRVLTPHAGEFARLTGEPLRDQHDDHERLDRAAALVRSLGSATVVVLKGPRTVTTDGKRYAVNSTGNPGMATGGSGDVLTGIVTALLAQGLPAFDAARLAAQVHGLAGDLAAAELGQLSLTAPDLIDWLPKAWQALGA